MELETMFTEQKWNILKCLSEKKYSPLQLAEKLDTTMANISQQLKLLEATNLVKKEKIRNRDKGKPRTLFSLRQDQAYLISAMDSFADKRLVKVTEHHKIILKIWFLEDPELQYYLEEIYWRVQSEKMDITAIAVNENAKEVILVSDKEKPIQKLNQKFSIDVKIFQKKEAEKKIRNNQDFTIIYDPERIISFESEKRLLNAQ